MDHVIGMEDWLVISNCQTLGLAHSLQMLNPLLNVTGVDILQYRQNLDYYNDAFEKFSRVIVTHETETLPGARLSNASLVGWIPHLNFAAFHPDLTYVTAGKTSVKGPLDEYHSAITLAAYKRGLNVERTLQLFNAHFFEACGYMDRWIPERDEMFNAFSHYGLDIGPFFRRWARSGSFMYSVNHPRIGCLFDIARMYLVKEGYEAIDVGVLPHDNLVNSACFAVYPEIAETLGINGSYRFKLGDRYRHIDLAEFVAGCFAAYETHDIEALAPHSATALGFSRAMMLLG